MGAKTFSNAVLALLLSLSLTIACAVIYLFLPLILLILGHLFGASGSSTAESNGVAAVAGGVSNSFLRALVLAVPILFLIIFALLRKRKLKS